MWTLEYSAKDSIYRESNQLEEKLSKKILFVMIESTPNCIFLPWITHTLILYFVTDLGADAFQLPQPMWLPFDWKNPFGFLIAITIQYAVFSYGLAIGGCVLGFEIGAYVYAIGMSKTIKGSLSSIGQKTQAKIDQSILLKQLAEFFEYHSRAKQMTSNYSDICEPLSMMLSIWSLVTICGAFLMIQMQLTHHNANLVELLMTTVEIVYAFGVMFIACELGQRLSLAFAECSEIVGQFEWYLFPIEIKRMLPLMLNFTQQPFEVVCFGSKVCDRDTFKAVIRTAFSYFTVLRKFHN